MRWSRSSLCSLRPGIKEEKEQACICVTPGSSACLLHSENNKKYKLCFSLTANILCGILFLFIHFRYSFANSGIGQVKNFKTWMRRHFYFPFTFECSSDLITPCFTSWSAIVSELHRNCITGIYFQRCNGEGSNQAIFFYWGLAKMLQRGWGGSGGSL